MRLGKHSYFLGTDHSSDAICGNFTSIAGGVEIEGNDNHPCVGDPKLVSTFDLGGLFGGGYPPSGFSKGRVLIGNDVWIGRNAQILTGVTIGDGAIIAAHTVVTKDVPPYALVAGNPGEIKKFRFKQEQIQRLLTLAWWNWEDEKIRDALPQMNNIDTFINAYL